MAAFVAAAKSIIDEEGVGAVSIRRVSTTAGFSSATLYLYFEDINELITMSLISCLSDYITDIINSTPQEETPESEYNRTWRLFCEHAFAHPSQFHHLFFGPQANKIDSIAKKYYELFPEELEHATGRMFEMLGKGSLLDRNLVILESFATKLGLSAHEIEIANDLTIAYFQSFLQRAETSTWSKKQHAQAVDQFMEGAFFILRGPGVNE